MNWKDRYRKKVPQPGDRVRVVGFANDTPVDYKIGDILVLKYFTPVSTKWGNLWMIEDHNKGIFDTEFEVLK